MQTIIFTEILLTFIMGSGVAVGFDAMDNFNGIHEKHYEECEHYEDCEYAQEDSLEHYEEEYLNEHEECSDEGYHYRKGC